MFQLHQQLQQFLLFQQRPLPHQRQQLQQSCLLRLRFYIRKISLCSILIS